MIRRFLIAFGLLIIAISLFLCWVFTGVHAEHQSSEYLAWKNSRDSAEMFDPGCIRGGMALDLGSSEVLIGLSKDELFMKLGAPSASQPDLISFALGQCHWDWQHSELAVHIDTSGRVAKAVIRVMPFEGRMPPVSSLQQDTPQAGRP